MEQAVSTAVKPQVPWPEGGEAGFIAVEGGRVLYHFYGKDAQGIPLIFLHGGPGGKCGCFFKQLPLAKDHPMVFYNQLGSGGSPYDPAYTSAEEVKPFMTVEHFVKELDTVISHFGFREFVLVGSSWGTMLAVEYAAAVQPQGLRGLVLNGPFLNVDTWIGDAERLIRSLPDGEEMWQTVCRCVADSDYGERYQEINKIYSRNFNNRNPSSCDGTPTDPDPQNPEGISVYQYMWGPSEFSCTGTLRGHDSTRLLAQLSIPVLYVSGEFDSGSPQAAFHYRSMTPNGEVCVLPASAHNSTRERPEEFNAVLRGFLSRTAQH